MAKRKKAVTHFKCAFPPISYDLRKEVSERITSIRDDSHAAKYFRLKKLPLLRAG